MRWIEVPGWSLILCAAALGCGGSKASGEGAATPAAASPSQPGPAPAAKAAAPAGAAQAAESDGAPKALPKECAGGGDVCTPPGSFVRWHCDDPNPTVALALFAKGTPWTRAYLTRKTEAWNASGGASASGFLEFDEEVLILRHRAADKGGMQVSGAGGGYDAMRWNGSCVTLSGEEVTLRLPPEAKYAKVDWRWLDDALQEAMRKEPKIDEAYQQRHKHCKGATMGEVSKECETWDAKLSRRIVEYVRDGGEIPTPKRLSAGGT